MENFKNAKIVCSIILFTEFFYGIIIIILNKFSIIQLKPSQILIKSLYFISALIIISLFILKKFIFYSKSMLKLSNDELRRKMSGIFILLCAISEIISILGLILYFITGVFQASILLVGVSILSTLLVFPFDAIVSNYIEEIRRRREFD
ncbi:hypothetical protein NLC82_04170 [Candidatus Aminicenantes bacterium AC-335-A11]|nr:hypothetical protein [SCandidatus Aminicenantes bacterium Aminicenantia_JdfR_composite]MCP2618597.1 hypothetical protein [Candidatus Aminicenantes bacterium AC-335-A11]MCP2621061.1 hypothetical protein [Candidatus Aminicenantes bacterium AC-334-E05]